MSRRVLMKLIEADDSGCRAEALCPRMEIVLRRLQQAMEARLRLRTRRLVRENARLKARITHLERQAGYDSLTELPNRALLQDRLKQAIAHAVRAQEELAVLFVDLDNFKLVNDSLGHAAGDELLRAVAQRMQSCVREADTVGRLGGDEFVVVLQTQSADSALLVAAKILNALQLPFTLEEQEFFVNGSIGISLFPRDGTEAQVLLNKADTAMHRVKVQGRNNIQCYSPQMDSHAAQRLSLETELRRALERDELELHYQPQVDLRGRVLGLEALLRWQHPRLGLLLPARFTALAEETGLIVPIGDWVLRHAWQQALQWRQSHRPGLRVAVNLSARQFMQVDLVGRVRRILATTSASAPCLELEITETLLMQDVERATATLRALKDMGVQLAIDDFGIGYSSLSYLKRFPLDWLKIDQSFVHDIASNPDDATIASAIIAMAHSLRLGVIAEGVETAAQLGFLHSHGCDAVQGYYISAPLPAAAVDDWLQRAPQPLLPATRPGPARTVLIVDDDPMIVSLLALLLEDEGYSPLTAADAETGLVMMAGQAVDVLITDYRMPGLDGMEFLRRVRIMHPHTIRIMISASSDVTLLAQAINEGAIFRFLFKPVQEERLREAVREALLVRDGQRN